MYKNLFFVNFGNLKLRSSGAASGLGATSIELHLVPAARMEPDTRADFHMSVVHRLRALEADPRQPSQAESGLRPSGPARAEESL